MRRWLIALIILAAVAAIAAFTPVVPAYSTASLFVFAGLMVAVVLLGGMAFFRRPPPGRG